MSASHAALLRVIVVGVFLVVATAPALTQQRSDLPPPPPPRKLQSPDAFARGQLKAFDTNRDAKVTWQEFSAQLRRAFDEMDTKHRGYLTQDDLKRAYEKALADHGQPIPKDGS